MIAKSNEKLLGKNVKKEKLKNIFIIFILLMPSIIKVSFVFVWGLFYLLRNYDSIFEEIVCSAKYNTFEEGINKNFYLFITFFVYLVTTIEVLIPIINMYYYGNLSSIIDALFSMYFIFIISFFIFWLLVSISVYLVKSTLVINGGQSDIFKTVIAYLCIIASFLIIPDFLYSIIYSATMTLTGDKHGYLQMFYFAFMLHHQVPMNDYYMNIQDKIQHNFAYGLVSGLHVLTVKIVDGTIIAAIIVTLFSDKVLKLISIRQGKKIK
ncbi:hypothetical protein YDYSG_56850 [Paenibacillus tyrfis]|nr:hypothetical protein YDYSG_56850 [Paenibacillus tyrfis]